MSHPTDVVVLGGGVIGLSCALEIRRRGASVQLWDPAPGQGASHAAGGMLAPVSEASYDELDLLELLLESHSRWPGFAQRLAESSGVDPDLQTQGSLHVGLTLDDAREVWRTQALLESYDLSVARLSTRELRRLAPALAPGSRTALVVESDLAVDNRRVVLGLLAACERAGVSLVRRAGEPLVADGAVMGVVAEDGAPTRCDTVVLATGAAAGRCAALSGLLPLPVRPVKGQILRMAGASGLLDQTVRGTVHGDHVYLIPRGHGELAIGATSEELDDTRVTGRGLLELLRAATTLLPEVGELTLVDAVARLRPGTPDNGPLLGGDVPGLVVAAGHYRHGMLLAPVTAEVVADLTLDRRTEVAAAEPFTPARFRTEAPAGPLSGSCGRDTGSPVASPVAPTEPSAAAAVRRGHRPVPSRSQR
ncbi:glycine oxidase ThiO [Arsenicicoccus dermatophilus]|uniref:glycine oxidase ThiO n=1 Tax=Arsenicicoccus dermatophilus TaxID=1076331 RepID=UPI001F4CC50A|nr:glycine oxidase ThiO [Arsenicicoccus dermatophilus]MCH8612030.1 glycine oxidase ThiO [Arsenicicoccus dermatophilus]